MISAFPYTPAIWSYGIAALIFIAFAARILLGWRGGLRASVLFFAVLASAAWAGSVWATLQYQTMGWWRLACTTDAIRIGAWLAFLPLLLESGPQQTRTGTVAARLLRYLAVPLILLVTSAYMTTSPPWLSSAGIREGTGEFYAWLGASVFGLALTEQLYRRTPANRRWAVKPLVIGLAGMFAFDLLIYSGAALFHQVNPAMWAARGIANAVVIFFVGIATARNTGWTVDVYVSRDVVYQSTAVLMEGIYLLIVASAAYWVHFFGGDWGGTLRVALVFAALLGLAGLMLSGSLRARLKVIISKNLFSFRYDYRQEWLQFTRMLGTTEQGENLYQQVVRALGNLVESTGGAIWLERHGKFSEVANLNMPRVPQIESVSGSLASFLARTDWVIRIDEFTVSPGKYPDLALPDWLISLENAWLVVPLPNGPDLIGFVILARPRAKIDVNWEVRDLLKTASRQAASYIAQIRTKEALVETEQFDAFNRMSAFVVHDLKNLVAQLALVVKNAERHRDNPEFQKDMLETVEHAVGRMNQLMLQLRTGTNPMEKPRLVELADVIRRIIQAKGRQRETIEFDVAPDLRVLSHEDRIERVIGHIVQNAIEASEMSEGGHGGVKVRAFKISGQAVVEISDKGNGMTEEFMREQLFHPFQTTKPQGMGIGMYESMQYVRSIGGRIVVESAPNAGSRFDVILPLANDAGPANELARQPA